MVMGRPTQPLGILPNKAFVEIARSASLERYRLDPRTRVRSEDAFRQFKEHIADVYADVEVVHSFEDAFGQVFDCIPIEQQPSLRGAKDVARPPDLRPVLEGKPAEPRASVRQPLQGEPPRDRHGNVMQAPPGTIPMRRITLDELSRFRDLDEFRRKAPGGGEAPRAPTLTHATRGTSSTSRPTKNQPTLGPHPETPSTPDPDPSKNHRYAYTHQSVDNIGAHDVLALYAPTVDANQIFSLAQHWYTAGDGAGHQTLEVGWQVYPAKYGHAQPVLFIYWTADNYATTGAYNLDGPGFVQTNGAWTIGGALSPVSVVGGQQMEIEIGVYLSDGNWWIYVGGIAAENALGYYPTSIYAGGALATNATSILFGGETVCTSVSWPPMGSGAMASAGWQQAAYQRDIYYFPTAGGSQWAALTPEEPSPGCYTLSLASSAAPWGVYFFYGGPGGTDC